MTVNFIDQGFSGAAVGKAHQLDDKLSQAFNTAKRPRPTSSHCRCAEIKAPSRPCDAASGVMERHSSS